MIDTLWKLGSNYIICLSVPFYQHIMTRFILSWHFSSPLLPLTLISSLFFLCVWYCRKNWIRSVDRQTDRWWKTNTQKWKLTSVDWRNLKSTWVLVFSWPLKKWRQDLEDLPFLLLCAMCVCCLWMFPSDKKGNGHVRCSSV